MPTPLEPDCWKTLFAMTTALGAVSSQAKNRSTWDKASLAYMGSNLMRLVNDCSLAVACADRANTLADTLGEFLNSGEVDPEHVDGQLATLGQHMLDLTGCLFDTYAIIADTGTLGGRTFTDWPDDDWLFEYLPKRVRAVR